MAGKKRLLALILAAALLTVLLGACGSQEEPDSVPQPGNSQQDPNGTGGMETQPGQPEELTELTFWYYDLYNHGSHGQKIIDAVNEITEPLLGIRMSIEWFDAGSYTTQLGLAIADGTVIDLISIMPAPPTSVATLHASGKLMEIDALLQEYAPQAYGMMEPYLSAYSYEGGVFGIPARKNWASNKYIMMREDVLQELGLYDFAAQMTTWSEYEQVMQQVMEAKGGSGMYALGRAKGNSVTIGGGYWPMAGERFDEYSAYDSLGDSLGLVSTDDAGNVGSYWADPRTVAECERLADWNARGYIWPDSAFSDTDGDDLVSGGVIFSKMEGGEIGVETRQRANCDTEMLCVQICDGYISTSSVTSWGLAIPITSEEPEAACRFIDQLYTNAELLNILLLGIEGEDYVFLPSGEVDYPEGLDSNSVEYHQADWMFGNQSLVHVWAGDGADYRQRAEEANAACDVSPYLGFTVNSTELETQIATLSAVLDQYQASMRCGLYTQQSYEEFLSKLETAGLQAYLDAFQLQLDAWLTENG